MLIKSFFNINLNKKILNTKFKSRKKRRLTLNKIYVSKSETKFNNNKIIITLYILNKEKLFLLKNLNNLRFSLYMKILSYLINNKNKINNIIYLKKELIFLNKYLLNKFKFKKTLLLRLILLINKYYNKKIEFNIINLKYVSYNSDIFTESLALRLKRKKLRLSRTLRIFFNKIKFPNINTIIEKYSMEKEVNKTRVLLNGHKYNNNHIINNSIFEYIKYKNIGGIRLEIKGRLTKRYRADRALFKIKWKGSLKNIDSSYKGLSTSLIKGYMKPNTEYSIARSKRRIGSFAIKGWLSGK